MWLIILTIVIFVSIIIFMPKHMTWLEIYATAWFALTFQLISDVILGLKFHLYGYFNYGEIDFKSFILIPGLYPTFSTIFLNFFPKSTHWKQTLYILGTSVFLVCFEFALLQTEAYYHNGWKLWYSALCYPLILLILHMNHMIIRWMLAKVKH